MNERVDNVLLSIASQHTQMGQGVEGLLDTFFGFLARKTDFFTGAEEGVAEQVILKAAQKQANLSSKVREARKQKRAKAEAARKAQLEREKALREKAAKENNAYYEQVLAQGDAAARNQGFLPNRRQATSERELFAKQGAAGINFSQYSSIKVETSGKGADKIKPMASFAALQKPKFLNRNIKLMRYGEPTPIQKHAIPVALAGRDLMCCAQTGSGKTCAFLMPVVMHLQVASKWADHFVNGASAAPSALVLAPTRELAIQIELEAQKLCNGSGILAAVVYGGANARGQLTRLADGVDIVVATPGRLQDFVDRKLVSLSRFSSSSLTRPTE